MKKLLLFILICLTVNSFAQHWDWVKQPVGLGSGDLRLSVGPNGLSYVSSSSNYNNYQLDCHLIKQSNGVVTWDKNFGKNMIIKGLSTTTNGDVFASGIFKDTISINGVQLISSSAGDAFLFKLNPQGQTIWTKTFSGSGNDFCNDVYLDYSGNILVTGSLGTNAVIDGITYPGKGLFVGKFNQTGTLLKMIRSTGGGQGQQVKCDSLNNIYVLGDALLDTMFLDTVIVYPPYYYNTSSFLAKFDTTGIYKGFVSLGSAIALDVDPCGALYVLDNSYYSAASIKAFSSSMALLWQKNYTKGNAIALNSKRELVVCGSLFNADTSFTYYWKYDKNGNLLDEAFSIPHQQINGRWMKLDANDNVYLIGNYYQATDFGNIHLNMNPGQTYFMGKMKGKKPFASFTHNQGYEVQSVYFKSRCLNDTSMRWIFPGSVPAISTQTNPSVSYATPGNKIAILIAYNGFSSDTTIQQINVRSEPLDTIYIKTIDQASWGCCSTPLYNTTSDGGFIVGTQDIYKFNKNGSLEWRAPDELSNYPGNMTEVKGGYVTLSNGANFPWIKRSDALGKIIWTKGYSGSPSALGLCASYEGGYLTAGTSVIKNDSVGNILWQFIYPLNATNVLQHTNGKYIIQGLKNLNGVNHSFLAQINGDGTMNWIKGYSNTHNGSINTTIICKNKDVVITGNGGNWGSQESYILSLDSMGNLKWAKTYKAGEFWITGVADVGSGKLMIICNLGGLSNTRQIVIGLLDQNGNVEWNRVTDINDMSMSHGIVSHGDGHAFFFGMKNQYNFIGRINLLPPPCLPDSININVTVRTTSQLTTTAPIDTSNYVAINSSIYQTQVIVPIIPHIECTTSGGVITGISIQENTQAGDILVFPNPSTGQFYIRSQGSEKLTYCIYDVLGNCVLSKISLDNDEQKIDLGNQSKGIYFLEIISSHQKTVMKISLQ